MEELAAEQMDCSPPIEGPHEEEFPEISIIGKIAKRKSEATLPVQMQISSETTDEPLVKIPEAILDFYFENLMRILCNHSDDEQRIKAATSICIFLSSPRVVLPIKEAIEANLVPELVNCLQPDKCPEIQYKAAWSLTNIATGDTEQVFELIRAGAVEHLIYLLNSNPVYVAKQSLWALANIIGDSPPTRDICIVKGAFDALMVLATENLSNSHMEHVSRAICNISRYLPSSFIKIDKIRIILHKCTALLSHEHKPVVFHIIFAIYKISSAGKAELRAILATSKLLCKVVALLSYDEILVQKWALQIILNIISDDHVQLRTITVCKPLPHYQKLLTNPKEEVLKDAICLLTLMALKKRKVFVKQIYAMGFMPLVLKIFEEANMPVQNEILQLIYIMLVEHIGPQCQVFADVRVFKAIHQLLDSDDKEIKYFCLRCLAQLFEVFRNHPTREVVTMATEIGIPQKLEEQYKVDSKGIRNLCTYILLTYFQNDQ